MNDITKMVRVRFCVGCKQYCIIIPENFYNIKFIKLFDLWHFNHIVGIIGIKELDPSYTCVYHTTDLKREKIYEELKESFIEVEK